MICDVCKEPNATIYLTQIVEGNLKKVNLCEECAKKKNVTDPGAFALADLLMGIDSSSGNKTPQQPQSGERICFDCGFTQTDFKKTGRLGCARCYDVFQDDLKQMLKGMYKNTRHIGKTPQKHREARNRENLLIDLRSRLKSAVESENYEEAAQIRDEINALEIKGANA